MAGLILPEWKSAVIPGLYFISAEAQMVVYGKILKLQQDGYLWTVCYHHECSYGEESKLHQQELTMPLSVEQFGLARILRWPSATEYVKHILALPPN